MRQKHYYWAQSSRCLVSNQLVNGPLLTTNIFCISYTPGRAGRAITKRAFGSVSAFPAPFRISFSFLFRSGFSPRLDSVPSPLYPPLAGYHPSIVPETRGKGKVQSDGFCFCFCFWVCSVLFWFMYGSRAVSIWVLGLTRRLFILFYSSIALSLVMRAEGELGSAKGKGERKGREGKGKARGKGNGFEGVLVFTPFLPPATV